jgi:hypothetical protein
MHTNLYDENLSPASTIHKMFTVALRYSRKGDGPAYKVSFRLRMNIKTEDLVPQGDTSAWA